LTKSTKLREPVRVSLKMKLKTVKDHEGVCDVPSRFFKLIMKKIVKIKRNKCD
jgi:hypothetical protein